MGVTAGHGWRWPNLTDIADAAVAFQNALNDVSATIDAAGVVSYTPSWTSDGALQPTGPSVRTGRYRLSGGYCTVSIYLGFSASTGGGTGPLHVGLPLPVSGSITEQALMCKLWVPSTGAFLGFATVGLSGNTANPYFPANPAAAYQTPWQSANTAAAQGTGVPAVAGQYTVQNGGNFILTGRYLTA